MSTVCKEPQGVHEKIERDGNPPTTGASVRGYMPPSKTTEWGTPPALFRQLDAEFHFDLDVAATRENALCARFFIREDDAIVQPWRGTVYCNPP
jgi:hypothetical protein